MDKGPLGPCANLLAGNATVRAVVERGVGWTNAGQLRPWGMTPGRGARYPLGHRRVRGRRRAQDVSVAGVTLGGVSLRLLTSRNPLTLKNIFQRGIEDGFESVRSSMTSASSG
jgi:hypothetical protein